MSKYEAVYFVGDNQSINRVRVDSSKTRNRVAFSGSLAALILARSQCFFVKFLTRLLYIVSQAKQSKQLLTEEIRLLSKATTYILPHINRWKRHESEFIFI